MIFITTPENDARIERFIAGKRRQIIVRRLAPKIEAARKRGYKSTRVSPDDLERLIEMSGVAA